MTLPAQNRTGVLLAICAAVVVGAVTTPRHPAQAAQGSRNNAETATRIGRVGALASSGDPATWAKLCSGTALGLDTDTVGYAPVLTGIDGDKAPNGRDITPKPDSRGRWVPVILVHGWVSQSTHDAFRKGAFSHVIDLTSNRLVPASADRSLVGQLQGVPGAAVFTFDYRDYAARWVDDAHLGPALGKVIDCLYAASGRQKVILVGHSMGGLISRWAAAHPGVTGVDRSAEISTAVTFGTPELGSLAAQIAAFITDPQGAAANATQVDSKLLPLQATLLGSILSACGRLSTNQVETGTLCDILPTPARAFASDSGVALRYGSRQIRELPPWPTNIVHDAIAGDSEFTIPGAGWFAKPWDVDRVPMGDMIVTSGSALSGGDPSKQTHCSYQLNAYRGATDQLGLWFGLASRAEVAQQPLGSFSGPCFHTSLMRGRELTNEALGAVNDDIASRQPVSEHDLLTAPVPASCKHKAGTLSGGKLLGIPARNGYMQLAWLGESSRSKSDLLRLGDFDADGLGDALTVLNCNAGGVPWHEILAFYSRAGNARTGPGLRLVAWGFTSDLVATPAGENSLVEAMVPAAGPGVRVTWLTEQDDDCNACATADVTATLTLVEKGPQRRIGVTDVSVVNELPTARRFFTAVSLGNSSDADAVAAPGVGNQAISEIASDTALWQAVANGPTCRATISLDLPIPVAPYVSSGGALEVPGTDRVCYAGTSDGRYAVAGLARTGIGRWQVAWWRTAVPFAD